MEGSILIDILVLLAAALVLGTLAEQLRQSAIVGYLVAGALVGPHVLQLVRSPEERVQAIADLGVALLLFTIGLEFSVRRLKRLGAAALVGGSLQIVLTGAVVAAVASGLGMPVRVAVLLGGMIALSSTASVLRLLTERAEIESPYGRDAMGVLLLQDLAVLPLTLLVFALGGGQGLWAVGLALGRTLLYGAMMAAGFLLLFNVVVPRLLNIRRWAANREFPILLAVILALGSATAAHLLGISPAIGAFLAGVLLAETPFDVQIRADVAPIRTVLVTLFFASIGMLFQPSWVLGHAHIVGSVVLAIIVGKAVIVLVILRVIGREMGMAAAAGICLAQVGEFAFVLAESARGPLVDEYTLNLVVSVTVITLFLTPYLVRLAPVAAGWVERWRMRRQPAPPAASVAPAPKSQGRIILVGFGPAGQQVAVALLSRHREQMAVVELNPRSAGIAHRYGLPMRVGNAAHPEVLESAGIHAAAVVVVTVPDPESARQIIHQCQTLNAAARVIVRARYHAYRWEMQMAGAETVVDEEEQVGLRLAAEVRRALHSQADEEERGE